MGEACLNTNSYAATFSPHLNAAPEQPQNFAWYVLKVRTGGEAITAAALRDRGFAPYFPTQKERRRYTDRMKVVDKAVFPGYVFCQFDLQHKLPITTCPGVEYVLGFAGQPAPISDIELANIRRMLEAGAKPAPALVMGERVRVKFGPLAGVEGVLVRDSTAGHLVVSIELLNRGASLQVKEDEVCAVECDSSFESRNQRAPRSEVV